MHILFLTDNFPPETNAPASRTFEHACEWVKVGHRVTVITCAPNFPKGQIFDGYRNRFWQQEEMAGIRVIRVWSYVTGNEGFVLRTLDFISFMLSGFLAALFVRKPDVIIGTSPQFFTAVAAWAASAVKRKPFVFELRDIWPESIRAVGAMKNRRILGLLEKLEVFLYSRASAVISVTHSFKRNLMARGIDGDKIFVVTNGVDSRRFHPLSKDPTLSQKLGIENCFVAGYIGTHGMAHALDTLLDAAAILMNDPASANIRLLLLGDGAERERLKARAKQLGLRNVIFCASVTKEEVVRYWSVLDLAIIHLRRSDLFTTVIPSKLFECMGMGIPIILGVEGESAEIVRQAGAGITIEPENAKQLADQIRILDKEPCSLQQMSSAGVASAKGFDRVALAQSMLNFIHKVVK
ncbi:glycosyltransferase family 4 protein [Kordiimonas lipolytica]|uniref:Glycosyltransferase family 4 protein n=1 Tax=Kordiimonas lipolytica TaxID=1662421 RepID=A0ABV8U6C9_9PROT|nr:glycosyltransferase family 4 protein [Kordiimonas lipolytica]